MGVETALLIASVAGAAVSAVGQIQAGAAQQDAANAQAQQALNEGAYRQDAAKAQAEKIRKAGRAQVGEANASLAASGVKLGEGTPLEVQKTITQNYEQDAMSSILTGKRAVSSAQQEAQLLGKAGDNAVTNSYFGAASTVLGSAGTIAKGWKAANPSTTTTPAS